MVLYAKHPVKYPPGTEIVVYIENDLRSFIKFAE